MENRDLESLKRIGNVLKKSKSVILIPHVNIDGDDLGSMTALSLGLNSLGIKTVCMSHDLIPDNLNFLKNVDKFVYSLPNEIFDTLVFMECTNLKRVPENIIPQNIAKTVINIDHHVGNTLVADESFIDISASAVGEMVFELLHLMEIKIDKDMATALYLSIISDTGGFRYSNTTEKTFDIARKLVILGADISLASKKAFLSNKLDFVRLSGYLMTNLKSECNGKFIWSHLTFEKMQEFGLSKKDLGRLPETLNIIDGCIVFCIFTEKEDGTVSVSLRSSSDDHPIRDYALTYGGGGHMLASGCTLESKDLIIELVEKIKKDLL